MACPAYTGREVAEFGSGPHLANPSAILHTLSWNYWTYPTERQKAGNALWVPFWPQPKLSRVTPPHPPLFLPRSQAWLQPAFPPDPASQNKHSLPSVHSHGAGRTHLPAAAAWDLRQQKEDLPWLGHGPTPGKILTCVGEGFLY